MKKNSLWNDEPHACTVDKAGALADKCHRKHHRSLIFIKARVILIEPR